MKRRVRIYVEGGATGKTADADFRRGWGTFLSELRDIAQANGYHTLTIVRGKGRSATLKILGIIKRIFRKTSVFCLSMPKRTPHLRSPSGTW